MSTFDALFPELRSMRYQAWLVVELECVLEHRAGDLLDTPTLASDLSVNAHDLSTALRTLAARGLFHEESPTTFRALCDMEPGETPTPRITI